MRKIFHAPEQEAAFRTNGYVIADLLPRETAAELKAAYRKQARVPEVPFYTTTWFEEPGYRRTNDALVREAVAEPLAGLLVDFDILYASFIIKKRGWRRRVGLHADWQFVDETLYCALNVWTALEDLNAWTGTLQVVPGSHEEVRQPRGPNYELDPVHLRRRSDLQSISLKQGQALVYDTRLLHASGPNLIRRERVVASALVVPSEAKALYQYFDPEDPGEPAEKHWVDRSFYLERCNFRREESGWPYVPPIPT